MTDDVLIRRSPEETATAENSPAAEWGARPAAAALKGESVDAALLPVSTA